jgi:hypothetical protein
MTVRRDVLWLGEHGGVINWLGGVLYLKGYHLKKRVYFV